MHGTPSATDRSPQTGRTDPSDDTLEEGNLIPELLVNPLEDELGSARRAEPCVLVIFGATGDLTRRKLLPSLLGLAMDGMLPRGFSVIGFARREKTSQEFRKDLASAFDEGDEELLRSFEHWQDQVEYLRSSFDDPDGYQRLAKRLEELQRERGTPGNVIYYLATPPSAYETILHQLTDAGLSREVNGGFRRVIIEKPFGRDSQTAQELNTKVRAAFKERQVFRIDHYLGKETVQNILALRFANSIFEPLWNQKFIDHVQITVSEAIGMEGRGAYFEEAGIVRDMIQNHLLQVLTLVAMEPPISNEGDAIRDEKVKVLRAIRSFGPDEVRERTLRAQYINGYFGDQPVPGYLQEPQVDPLSKTETFAAIQLFVDNWRWAGTPFYLRAGKRMPRRATEVAIHFKRPPHLLYGPGDDRVAEGNVLLLRIQPDEGVSLRFGAKVPGPHFRLRDVRMDFRYGSSFGDRSADAYERLLFDAMIGDPTLFARRDEVQEAWRIVDSILDGWTRNDQIVHDYVAGTWGPDGANDLLGTDRAWRRP
ncbi:MAG: glucose-6-phosphate dehydrogenase [Planctomycetota bacterium]